MRRAKWLFENTSCVLTKEGQLINMLGLEPLASTPADFDALITSELRKWERISKALGSPQGRNTIRLWERKKPVPEGTGLNYGHHQQGRRTTG
jgi:hypothetical protein